MTPIFSKAKSTQLFFKYYDTNKFHAVPSLEIGYEHTPYEKFFKYNKTKFPIPTQSFLQKIRPGLYPPKRQLEFAQSIISIQFSRPLNYTSVQYIFDRPLLCDRSSPTHHKSNLLHLPLLAGP